MPHIFRTARRTNFKLDTRMETTTRISHRHHDLQGQGRKVTWSVWAILAQCCICVISGRRGHTVSAKPGGHTCLIWGDLHRITCVRYVRTAAWKSTFKSVFVGLHNPACAFQAVLRNTCNATDARLAIQSKNRNTQRMHVTNTMHAIDSILACVAFFVCVCFVA